MPAASELIAYGRTQEEVCKFIGADKLIYQDLPALIEAIQKKGKSHVDRFEASVFDGVYVTGDVTLEYLTQLELQRNDLAKVEQNTADSILELHNTR
jgi:amidophosphoribosyltransferase